MSKKVRGKRKGVLKKLVDKSYESNIIKAVAEENISSEDIYTS